jgi:hypothetical protein
VQGVGCRVQCFEFQSEGLGMRDAIWNWILGVVKGFRGGLEYKAHRLLYRSTLGSKIIKKNKVGTWPRASRVRAASSSVLDYLRA